MDIRLVNHIQSLQRRIHEYQDRLEVARKMEEATREARKLVEQAETEIQLEQQALREYLAGK
jgi:hypothetical protein